MDIGFYTVIGGEGEMFDNFVKNRKFGNYSGRGMKPHWPEDDDYNRCRLRILPFDQCFKATREPITKSE